MARWRFRARNHPLGTHCTFSRVPHQIFLKYTCRALFMCDFFTFCRVYTLMWATLPETCHMAPDQAGGSQMYQMYMLRDDKCFDIDTVCQPRVKVVSDYVHDV